MSALLDNKTVLCLLLPCYWRDSTSLMYCVSVYISCMLQSVCTGQRQYAALCTRVQVTSWLSTLSDAARGNSLSLSHGTILLLPVPSLLRRAFFTPPVRRNGVIRLKRGTAGRSVKLQTFEDNRLSRPLQWHPPNAVHSAPSGNAGVRRDHDGVLGGTPTLPMA